MAKTELAFSELDTQARQENPHYLCTIVRQAKDKAAPGDKKGDTTQKENIAISMYLPEQFQFSIGSSYSSPFAGGLVEGSKLGQLTSMLGMTNLVTQGATLQVWQGTTEVQFSLTFELHAKNDPVKEVLDPIKNLLKLTLPSRLGNAGGLLVPPGPSLIVKDSFNNLVKNGLAAKGQFRNEIALQIGSFLRFESVVIESVNHAFDSHFDARGLPMGANVDVSFKTFVVPTVEDIDGMFMNVGAASQGPSGGTTGQYIPGGDRGTQGGR